jgi:predicted DNA-binding transcriptional regulator YafY
MAVRQLSAAGDFILTYDALNAIRKIVSNSPHGQRELLRSSLDDVVLKEGFGCDSKILADLQKATLEGRRISISYDLYSEGGVKQYALDPYQIYFKRRALYLDAYSVEDKGYRVYRVNRIKRLQTLPMIVSRRPDYSFASRHRRDPPHPARAPLGTGAPRQIELETHPNLRSRRIRQDDDSKPMPH